MVERSLLGRARGLGAAASGTEHFWQQRLTSLALLPLTIFILGLMAALAGASHATVAATLARPVVAIPLFLFVVLTAFHMKLGMQVVIEDYVHDKAAKLTLLVANIFFSYGVGAIAAFALVKLAFGV